MNIEILDLNSTAFMAIGDVLCAAIILYTSNNASFAVEANSIPMTATHQWPREHRLFRRFIDFASKNIAGDIAGEPMR